MQQRSERHLHNGRRKSRTKKPAGHLFRPGDAPRYKECPRSDGCGKRLDHTLANLQSLVWLSTRGGRGFLVGEKCRNVLGPGTHATTFGGNPICAAAALATLDILSEEMMGEIADKGKYLRSAIESMDLPCLGKTRGLGLMIGIEVKPGQTNREVAAKLMDNGLLVLTAGPALRLLPPLTITKDEMDKGLAIMKQTLS